MVDWTRFDPARHDFEFAEEKLAAHNVTVDEAAECFEEVFQVRRNKSYRNRYRIIGTSAAGRPLELVVEVQGPRIFVITGWER